MKVLLWFIAWTCLGVLQTGRLSYWYTMGDTNLVAWPLVLIWAFGDMYLWGLASLLVYRISARVPFSAKSWWRVLAVHIPVAGIVSGIQIAAYGGFWWLTRDLFWNHLSDSYGSFFAVFCGMLKTKPIASITTYLLIAFVSYALLFYRQYREEKVRRAVIQAQLTRAKIDALRGHLQPHFLFNTLNTIAALIDLDPAKASQMISRLSELLRAAVDTVDVNKVTLTHELDILERYLDIQRVRFGQRLRTEIHVEERAMLAKVPTLMLQPIVENAIVHGIAEKTDGGTVKLEARCDTSWLWLRITDTGPAVTLEEIVNRSHGVGLTNTRERLQTMYGNYHTLDIGPGESEGVVVAITLPLELD